MKASSRLLLGAALIAGALRAREVLLLAFVGVVIAVVFSFPVGWLSRWMPRSVAVILVLLALAGVAGAFVALVAPSLTRQVSELRASLPRAIREARGWLYQVQPEENAQKIEEKAGEALDKAGEKALPALFSVVSSATAVLRALRGRDRQRHPWNPRRPLAVAAARALRRHRLSRRAHRRGISAPSAR
jgi:predicted PurR-regulated permease PerM